MAFKPLSPAQQLQKRIPFAYKLLLLWIEPVAALVGSLMALLTTDDYFAVMTPRATPLAATPHFQVVFEQLGATYLLFALNEAVLLRASSELRVWKVLVFGILCCDFVHLYATGRALGGLHTLVTPGVWRWEDWVNLAMLYVPISMRIAFCLGVGIAPEDAAKKSQ